MNCPRCTVRMEEVFTKAGVVIDRCQRCEGSWFDDGEIYAFTKHRDQVAKALAKGLIDPKPATIACPRCASPLTEGGFVDARLRIDRCDGCGGLWFDEGEMRAALEFAALLANPAAGARRPTRTLGKVPPAPPAAPPPERPAPPPEAAPPPKPEAPRAPLGAGVVKAALAAAPALPNLFVRGAVVGASLFGLLYLVLFLAVTIGMKGNALVALGICVALTFFQFLISPFVMDLTLGWFYSMRWAQPHELPAHLRKFVEQTAAKHGMQFPRIGIIDDGSPNAFTYGHTPSNARIVITRGLMDVLDPDELDAVVGHEMGHAVHWDVAIMTAASVVPVVLYFVYDTAVRIARSKGSSSRNDPRGYAVVVAIVAYLCYVISDYLVRYLSRVREYYADRFAAEETENPAALASALVKVAYGIVYKEAEKATAAKQAKERGETVTTRAGVGAIAALGIVDAKASKALAASTGFGDGDPRAHKEAIADAMQWDLWNPWALYFEVHSTHPLVAKRIDQLGRVSQALGQEPFIVFDRQKPESYWDDFAVDVLVNFLPILLMVGMGGLAFGVGLGPKAIGAGILGLGIGLLVKTLWSYPNGSFPKSSVAGLLAHVKVSHVRPVPATIEGEVVGKGVPGLVWDEDMVVRDRTGLILLDYRQPLALIDWIFGLTAARTLQGKRVVATGWYRRAPVPYVELSSITDPETGKTYGCYTRAATLVLSVLTSGAGAAALVLIQRAH